MNVGNAFKIVRDSTTVSGVRYSYPDLSHFTVRIWPGSPTLIAGRLILAAAVSAQSASSAAISVDCAASAASCAA